MKRLDQFLADLKDQTDISHPINKYLSGRKEENFQELLERFPEYLNREDENGFTPLVFSLKKGFDEEFKLILLKIIEKEIKVDYNAVTKENLCLLGYVMNRRSVNLLKFFLINTKGKINKSTQVFGDNVYYSTFHLRNMSRQRKLAFVNVFLQFKFTLPIVNLNTPTISQYCIRFYRNLIETASLLYKIDYVKLIKEVFGRLFNISLANTLKCSRRENIVHHCIYYNTPILLDYILEILSLRDKRLLKRTLEARTAHDYSMLVLACLPAFHQERFNIVPRQESRVDCVKVIMKYIDLDLNEATHDDRFTALHYTLSGNFYHLKKQEEMTLFLIENGADLYFHKNKERSEKPIYWIYQYHHDKVLKALLEKGLIDVDLTFDDTNVTAIQKVLISALYRLKINRRDPRDTSLTQQLDRAKAMATDLMQHGCKVSSFILQHILMFYNNKYGCDVVSYLLKNKEAIVDVEDYPLTRYITVSTMCKTKAIFNSFIRHDILFSTPMKLDACKNTPPHRWYTFENTVEKYKYFNLGTPRGESCTGCDLCGRSIPTFGENPLTTCSVRSCDLDLCSSCAYFTVENRSRGIDAHELANRVKDIYFLNALHFLAKIKSHAAVYKHSAFKDNLEAFRNAKLDHEVILKRLSHRDEERLGLGLSLEV